MASFGCPLPFLRIHSTCSHSLGGSIHLIGVESGIPFIHLASTHAIMIPVNGCSSQGIQVILLLPPVYVIRQPSSESPNGKVFEPPHRSKHRCVHLPEVGSLSPQASIDSPFKGIGSQWLISDMTLRAVPWGRLYFSDLQAMVSL